MKKLLLMLGIGFALFLSISIAFGQTCSSADQCQKLISEYEQKLKAAREQKSSLASQIEFMDTQIYLTGLRIQEIEHKIQETEVEIQELGGRIEGLDTSLDHLSRLLRNKIVEGYKRRDVPFFNVFLDPENATELANRIKYTQIAQENDRRVAFQVQQAKSNFEEQKSLRERKKIELDQLKAALDNQTVDLANQKADRQRVLAQTQNDERRYQALITEARAEQAAIQGIVAGAGTETEIRDVKKGDVIASVISGASCNSTGSHLHFTVLVGGGSVDPFNHLKSASYNDNSGGDSWHPSGSWDWPVDPTIDFNQGYGSDTWFIRTYHPYSFHNGIDISGASSSVKAVADGTLYRGSYSVGCALPYTKVVHNDGDMTTLYLHTYTN